MAITGYKSTEGGAGTGNTITLTNGLGDLLVAVCGEETSSGTITGITDTTAANVWVALAGQTNVAHYSRVFYCLNNTSGSSHTLTFNVSGTHSNFAQMGVIDAPGYNTLDQSAQVVQTSTTGPNAVTTVAAEIVIGLQGDSNGAFSPNTGWTAAVSDTVPTNTTTRLGIIYQIQSSKGTYTPTWTANNLSGFTTLSFYLGNTFVPMAGAFGVGI